MPTTTRRRAGAMATLGSGPQGRSDFETHSLRADGGRYALMDSELLEPSHSPRQPASFDDEVRSVWEIVPRCVFGKVISFLILLTLNPAIPNGTRAQNLGPFSPGLGFLADYTGDVSPGFIHEVPELGIEIVNGTGRLETGATLSGVRVIRVLPKGPAARAGIRDQRTRGRAILTGALVAGGLIFPPILLAAFAVGQSDLGDSYDTIIAVDAERTRDVIELENAIRKGRGAPIVYLSVVRDGKRNQVQVVVWTEGDQMK
jgi:PDZ domain